MIFITVNTELKRKVRLFLIFVLLLLIARVGLELGKNDLEVTARLHAVRRVETDQQALALTFNLDWGKEIPALILEVLKAEGVKATFFVSGTWAETHPDLLRQIVAEGHEIGNLGYEQKSYRGSTGQYVRGQIEKTLQAVERAAGVKPRYFRPPTGLYDDLVITAAAEAGHITVKWDTDSLDWTNPGPDVIVRRVLGAVHPGDIVLLTASDGARQTLEALPQLVGGLKKKGYTLLILSDLMKLDQE